VDQSEASLLEMFIGWSSKKCMLFFVDLKCSKETRCKKKNPQRERNFFFINNLFFLFVFYLLIIIFFLMYVTNICLNYSTKQRVNAKLNFMLTWFLKLIELMADGCKVDMCRLKNRSI
jgi:predicted nucleic acid-binding Zn ribbon protein